jgi:alkylation response protein AidB-like acyl-CoA dehydrogenase
MPAKVAASCIQVHGGMGFTWEHPAHLYFKRAKADEHYLGDPARHRAVIADRLGLQPSRADANIAPAARDDCLSRV